MFFLKARTVANACNALEVLIGGFGAFGGIPAKVWTDPYAMGWVSGYSASFAMIYSGGKFGDESIRAGWDRVSPTGCKTEVFRRLKAFMEADNADFRRGYEAAMKTLLYGAGVNDFPGDPDIAVAKERVRILAQHGLPSTGGEREAVAGELQATLFYRAMVD